MSGGQTAVSERGAERGSERESEPQGESARSGSGAAARALGRLAAAAWIWAPVLVVVVLAWPSVDYMLPGYASHLGENYQPIKALRFFASPWTDYHKYGPMTNFLLAPGYALSLGGWWLTGQFGPPSSDFPYGFARPLEQISFLIWQGRVLFLLLFVGCSIAALRWGRDLVARRWALAAAFLFCVATDFIVMAFVANTRPDGPMFAFLLLWSALYARILVRGLTPARGVGLSLLAVFAITAKEQAATVFVLPYLALGWRVWRDAWPGAADDEARRALRRAVVGTLATGVVGYLLLNAVYAPAVWLERMSHWLTGGGIDAEVWGGVGSAAMTRLDFARILAATFLNTLGPAGIGVVSVAVATLVVRRPRYWLELLMPFASAVLLGLIPIGYGGDRFTAVATICLWPAVALGLVELAAVLRERPALRRAGAALLAGALGVNLLFATFAWHRLDGLLHYAVEQHLAADPPGAARVAMPQMTPHVEGKSRLTWLGYAFDPRSLQQVIDAAPGDRPERLYVSAGLMGFLEDAEALPGRVEMLREHGLDLTTFEGFESLGYRLGDTITPQTPAWFVFDWMPVVRSWREGSRVQVYVRGDAGASGRSSAQRSDGSEHRLDHTVDQTIDHGSDQREGTPT